MANEQLINQISTIQRALGIIEGVAIGLNNDAIGSMLYTAKEMIEEAVEGIINCCPNCGAKMDGDGNGSNSLRRNDNDLQGMFTHRCM